MDDLTQPNATRMPVELLEAVLESIPSVPASTMDEVVYRDQHSNDFAEIRFDSGRSLIVKRGRFDWAEPRFRTSRVASRLIRESTTVAVPAPLEVPDDLDERPLEAYWRLDQSTLQEVWPDLDERQRTSALRSWGELLARVHAIEVEGFGALCDPGTTHRSLEDYLTAELVDRLLPAVTGEWPAALPSVHRLIRWIDEAACRANGSSRLVHNDMHMGNVLCEVEGDAVRCVGLIDLETAVAAPREADLAVMEVHHGALFSQPIDGEWFRTVSGGYGDAVDPGLTNFYRAYHLINMGFYSALIGHDWHAQQVAAALARETAELERQPVVARRLARA